jgi:hypothetical protein
MDEMRRDGPRPSSNAALGQPHAAAELARRGGQVRTPRCPAPTWQYPDGTFTEILQRGPVSEELAGLHRWCWKETSNPSTTAGWTNDLVEQQAVGRSPAEMWRVEFELGKSPRWATGPSTPSRCERMFSAFGGRGACRSRRPRSSRSTSSRQVRHRRGLRDRRGLGQGAGLHRHLGVELHQACRCPAGALRTGCAGCPTR